MFVILSGERDACFPRVSSSVSAVAMVKCRERVSKNPFEGNRPARIGCHGYTQHVSFRDTAPSRSK